MHQTEWTLGKTLCEEGLNLNGKEGEGAGNLMSVKNEILRYAQNDIFFSAIARQSRRDFPSGH
jgi:hypothetical protein